jgi:DedD protein
MALLDKGLKQRMVGALVLLALAVILLPMLLSRQDEQQVVEVNAPAMPEIPQIVEIEQEPVAVPEPQPVPEELIVQEAQAVTPAPAPVTSAAPTPAPATPAPVVTPVKPVAPAVVPPAPAPQSRLDANSLPISWSIQVASLSSVEGANKLQNTLRGQGYNAYVRSSGGMNRVFVGPVIDRAEADRMREQLNRKHNVSGFLVRFQPESR